MERPPGPTAASTAVPPPPAVSGGSQQHAGPPPPHQPPLVPADPLRTPLDLRRAAWALQQAAANATSNSSSDGGSGITGSGVMRVNQVDASVLDGELLDLLRIQLAGILAPPFFPPGVMDRFKPELNALLDALLFCSTVLVNEPTPGMRMQHLRFVDGTTATGGSDAAASAVRGAPPRLAQRLLLGFLYIGGKWGFARLRRYALVAGWADDEDGADASTSITTTAAAGGASGTATNGNGEGEGGLLISWRRNWKRAAYTALDRAESLMRLAWLINFLVFLKYGRYPSLLQRLTGMRLVYRDALGAMSRSINFQFMNRQLLWEHFTQLALCVVPLVDWDGLRRQVSGLIRQRRLMGGSGEGGGVPGAGGADGDMACVVCGEEEAHTPYVTDCGHIFCYYCLKLNCIQDDQFACPRCGTFFETSKRWVPPSR